VKTIESSHNPQVGGSSPSWPKFIMEEWRDIVGFPGYKVSSEGEILSSKTGLSRILKKRVNSRGYFYVNLMVGGSKYKSKGIHILVATAFHDKPFWATCTNRKDGNKLNNNSNNLEWTDNKGNMKHAVDTGLMTHEHRRGSNCNFSKLTENKVSEIIALRNETKLSYTKIANRFGVSRSNIIQIMQGKLWKHIARAAVP
jgi:DNA-binding transcriptional regulator YiaG